jgi:hypothetical protein
MIVLINMIQIDQANQDKSKVPYHRAVMVYVSRSWYLKDRSSTQTDMKFSHLSQPQTVNLKQRDCVLLPAAITFRATNAVQSRISGLHR